LVMGLYFTAFAYYEKRQYRCLIGFDFHSRYYVLLTVYEGGRGAI
jgi:hypothetical protein